jgi:hypothetical protein
MAINLRDKYTINLERKIIDELDKMGENIDWLEWSRLDDQFDIISITFDDYSIYKQLKKDIGETNGKNK